MVRCPSCDCKSNIYFIASDRNRHISEENFTYYRCSSCDHIYMFPIPENLSDYYPKNYYPTPTTIEQLAVMAEGERYKLDIVQKYVRDGRLLEIGPAHGCFAYSAKKAGFEVEAVEMDSDCCVFLQEKVGIKVINEADTIAAVRDLENYDVIVLWHVVEHLINPFGVLEALTQKLVSGGIILIATPNPYALQFRILGRFWAHVDAPRHLSLIPVQLLTHLMNKQGLKLLDLSMTDRGGLGWNFFGWIESLKNMTKSRYGKILMELIGRVINKLMRPLERSGNRGSAYTAIYQKE